MKKEIQQQKTAEKKRYNSCCNYTSDKNAKPKTDCSTDKCKNGTEEVDLIQFNS